MFGLDGIIEKVFGSRADRYVKKLHPLVARVNELEPAMKGRSNTELQALTGVFRARLDKGQPIDELLPEAFAVVREASVRTLGMRHFDVQLMGGIVLHRGMVAEMKTGEGKTLTATLPVYLNALSGKGVHIVTVNDYLASRDADWMGQIYNFLGLSVGKILTSDRDGSSKKAAYAADITYGTNNEFGFDYLRDNLKFSIDEYVQRGHHYAIVDEVDSILIDEARTPLIISGPTDHGVERYVVVDAVIPLLQNEIDYTVDEKGRTVALTDAGISRIEEKLGIDNLYDLHNTEILHHVTQALKAHTIFKRDRDYLVQNGKVIIIDEHTGRTLPGRRWSDGLHQAVEAKEKVRVEPESQTFATVTYQNYFRMYTKLAGMTGTAETEREEFLKIYNLDVMPLPTNRPVIRKDVDDVVYKTQAEKFRAILDEIEKVHATGQPILVGTVSVEKSEIVSRLLRQRGIPHEVLNARQHAREAEIVSQAGRKGAVTISTNMAGRGTDIKLGGDAEAMARAELGFRAPPEAMAEAIARYKEQVEAERAEVLAAGGLYIIGTERHESRRIDNQLRGRAGRQGDPGTTRFYMALEDDLLRIFSGDKLIGWMEKMGLKDDEAIEHRWINKSIEDAQRRVEGHNFNIRKNLLEYDDVMNLQRRAVYELRRRALMGESIREMMVEAIENLVDDVLGETADESANPELWDVAGLAERVRRIFQVEWAFTPEQVRDMAWEELRQAIRDEAMDRYETVEEQIGAERLREIERRTLLRQADAHWKDHLLAMDRLRDGMGLRGYGQKNPLLEYKREGTDLFRVMGSWRDEAVVTEILSLDPDKLVAQEAQEAMRVLGGLGGGVGRAIDEDDAAETALTMAAMLDARGRAAAPAAPAAARPPAPRPPPRLPAKGVEARRAGILAGLKRNDLCPCGSGQKFKKCCFGVDDAEWDARRAADAAAAAAALAGAEASGAPAAEPEPADDAGPSGEELLARLQAVLDAVIPGDDEPVGDALPALLDVLRDEIGAEFQGDTSQLAAAPRGAVRAQLSAALAQAVAQGLPAAPAGADDAAGADADGGADPGDAADGPGADDAAEAPTEMVAPVAAPTPTLPPAPPVPPDDLQPGLDARAWGLANGWKRNDPCPCGSGQKFKKCCLAAGEAESPAEP